jgi:hypothetical protein
MTQLSKYLWPLSTSEMEFYRHPGQIVSYDDHRFAHAREDWEAGLRTALNGIAGLPANRATLDKARKAAAKAVDSFNRRHTNVQIVRCDVEYHGSRIDLDPVIHHSGVPFDVFDRFYSYFMAGKDYAHSRRLV